MNWRKTLRPLLLTLGYVVLLQFCALAPLLLRYDGALPSVVLRGYLALAPAFTVLSLIGFLFAGLYHSLWRFAGVGTAFEILRAAAMSAAVLLLLAVMGTGRYPPHLVLLVASFELLSLGAARLAWRLMRERGGKRPRTEPRRALVVGADHTGVHLVLEMRRARSGEPLIPVGFVDRDPRLKGRHVEGLEVFGVIEDLPAVLSTRHADVVIVSDAHLPASVVREIARASAEAGASLKIVPALESFSGGRAALAQVRDVRIEDLLGREPVTLDLEEVGAFLRDQRVLVTGAGGSIGSELARQVAAFAPAELVLLDQSENGLYYVHSELASARPEMPLHAVLADIKDRHGLERVFEQFHPTVVLHAAAHKHVPLLEANPREAVLNNIVGTRHLVQCADRHGVRKFVLISTDKAVNPSSVMGASKRVCEMMLQSRSQASATRFVAVRFGNVLGSEGSVIPLFQRQLQRGGPLTVTDPEARRYFMTIPESVRLVLQAAAMGRGGEVFLLDMGEQVRILDLARQLIHMAGLREGHDIQIVFTGLRPGEKLVEELHSEAEGARATRHERIVVWDLDARDESQLLAEVAELERAALDGDAAATRERLHRLVPEYGVATAPTPVPRPERSTVVELPGAMPPRER